MIEQANNPPPSGFHTQPVQPTSAGAQRPARRRTKIQKIPLLLSIAVAIPTTASLILGLTCTQFYLENQALRAQFAQQNTQYKKQLAQIKQEFDQELTAIQGFFAFGEAGETAEAPSAINATNAPKNTHPSFSTGLNLKSQSNAIAKKYADLFSLLNLTADEEQTLLELLILREQTQMSAGINYYSTPEEIEQLVEQQQQALKDIDQKITAALPPEAAKDYDALKDSDYEQQQLSQFYSALGEKDTLSSEDKKQLLLDKIELRQQLDTYIEISGNAFNNADKREKDYLAKQVHQQLHDAKDAYLNSARQHLSPEQFDILREQEQKQIDEIWDSIQAGWGMK